MGKKRIVTASKTEMDADNEKSLRPSSLKEYIGQEKIKNNMNVFISAAKQRGDTLDHVLFFARPAWEKPPWLILLHMKWV